MADVSNPYTLNFRDISSELSAPDVPEHEASDAADTLLRIAGRVNPAALLVAYACHLFFIEPGTYREGIHGDTGLRVELLAYYLYTQWEGADRPAPSAGDVEECDAAINILLGTLGRRVEPEADLIVSGLRAEAEVVRGTAFPDQLAAQIIDVQGTYEGWYARRTGIGPRRAVQIIGAIVEAHMARSRPISADAIEYANVHETECRERGRGKPKWARVTDGTSGAWARAYSDRLTGLAPREFPVAPSDLKVDPPVSATEWEALIALIGLTSAARAQMAQAADVRTRPLYVLPEGRVLICDWATALDALWLVFEARARQDTKFFDGYQRRRGRVLERRIQETLTPLFPKASFYCGVTYPDPDRDAATAELDVLIVWEPFIVVVEAKAGHFRLQGRLGDVGRLRTDLQATVGEAAGQISRVLRYLESDEQPVFREKSTGRTRRIRMREIRRTFAFAVTQQELGHLGARLAEARSLGLFRESQVPVSMSIAKLETISRFCSGPEVFLHYLERRAEIQRAPFTLIADELNLFGAYLDNRLWFDALVSADEGEAPPTILITQLSERFDTESMHRLSGSPAGPAIQLNLPPGIEQLLCDLRSSPDRGARAIGFELLDLPQEALMRIAASLWNLRATPPPKRGILRRQVATSDETLVFTLGAIDLSPLQLHDALVQRALTDQYRRRSLRVIGLGLDLGHPRKPCVTAVWCGERWTSHSSLEERAREDSRVSPVPGWSMPGRNEPCWCGSGRKHKHCCLHRLG